MSASVSEDELWIALNFLLGILGIFLETSVSDAGPRVESDCSFLLSVASTLIRPTLSIYKNSNSYS